jgi:Ala-tRNA(Pro) deacylase
MTALTASPCSPDELIALLNRHGLAFERVEHIPVFTIDEALAATPSLPGIKTKNVFLRDAKGQRHFLVIVPHDRRLDLSALAKVLATSKLSMGSADRLLRTLGITPGAVSVFALVNDREQVVEVVLDEAVWQAAEVQAHPLVNTATVAIGHDALVRFLAVTGHSPRVVAVP